MLMQHFTRLLERRPDRRGDQIVFSHSLGDRQIEARLEAEVAVGENADQFAVRIGDRHSRNLVLLHHLQRLGDRLPRAHGHRVDDHARFRALDLVDLLGLLLDGHVLVDDAQSTLLGHGDGQASLSDRVHGRAEDGDIEVDVPSEPGGGVDEVGMQFRLRGSQQHVVEGQTDGNRFNKTLGRQRFPALRLP